MSPVIRRVVAAASAWLVLGAQAASALIVGSFNIRYQNEGDRERGNGWPERAPVIASLIRFHKFDVMGTQEVLHSQLEDLRALLPGYGYSGRGRDDGKEAGEYAAIFYRKDLFTLKAEGTFWLSETPGKPSIGWDAKFNRICTWVSLEENATRKTCFFFNTHFDHRGAAARLESARLIVASIRGIAGDHPAILTGDLNVDQTSDSYRLILDSGLLEDSYETAGDRYALNGTPNGFNVNSFTAARIDHVFHTRNLKPRRYGVLTDSYRTAPPVAAGESGSAAFPSEVKFSNFQGRTPSDHFPVLVEFE